MIKTKNILENLKEDLLKKGPQASWDWEADYRFAIIIKDYKSAEIIKQVIESNGVTAIRYAAVQSTGITKKRLNFLRKLKRTGVVKSYWSGLGRGAYSQFGIRRVRCYELIK